MKIISLAFLCVSSILVVGCDLSMNKNKDSPKNPDLALVNESNLPPDQPIPVEEFVSEPSPQVNQAEQWQSMNLASSDNADGDTLQLNPSSHQANTNTNQAETDSVKDFFYEYNSE